MKKSWTRLIWEFIALVWFFILIVGPLHVSLGTPIWAYYIVAFMVGWNWSSICQYFIDLFNRARKGE